MEKTEDQPMDFDEALEKTGNGKYNILLACTGALLLLSVGVEQFGFSLVVAGACDLNITVAQKGILTSLPFIGILLVSYPWGYISDTRGRRITLLVSVQVGFLLSCLSSLSPNWICLGIAKFLAVCFSCAANSITYTLVGECCIQRVRRKYMLLMTCLLLLSPAVAGIMTYPIFKLDFSTEIAWLGIVFKPWRLLIIVLSIPTGLGGVAITFFHESPKFLAHRGKKEEALEVMKSIYAINHRCQKEDFKVHSLTLPEEPAHLKMSLIRTMYEQSAPLFRPPYATRTLQLFYIVAVAYITNNSFLIWLPHIMSLVKISMESNVKGSGNICSLISSKGTLLEVKNVTTTSTIIEPLVLSPDVCVGTVDDNVVLTLIGSQCVYSFLNFILAYLPNHRRKVLLSILSVSAMSAICINLMPEPISSVIFFVGFTCPCLGMGILASYFVDLYPTSYRGMVSCLGIMVGRTSTFMGINLVGNMVFQYCQTTFYTWSLLVLSSVVATWFLPPDKPADKV